MKSRIDAASDRAMIGAWDSSRNGSVLTEVPGRKLDEALEQDATAGDIFLIRLGGDRGGPIEVYVDSPIPTEALTETRAADREFLLRLPSGRLVVDGVEDYRSAKPGITKPNSVVVLPPGDYAVRCYLRKSQGNHARLTNEELKAYFSRIDKIHLLGCAILLLGLMFPLGWKFTLLIALTIFLVHFYVQEEVVIKRDCRYRRISKQVNRLFRAARQKEPPCCILELRRIPEPLNLRGGWIRLDAAA